jgi:hypothetical protein
MKNSIFAQTLRIAGLLLLTVAWSNALGQVTVTCPAPPNQLTATVTSNVTFDSGTQLFTYTYSVSNSAKSAQEIDSFNLDFTPPVQNFSNPSGWTHAIFKRRSTLGWAATDPVPLPPGTEDNSEVPAGIAQIKPGQSLGGFSFQSPKPPGPVKYFVSGFVEIPPQDDEEGAETLVEQCPQSVGNLLDLAVVGTTQGPVNFIPVNIQIKPTAAPPVPINPGSQGVTPVAILGTSSFDVTTVDQSSVRLGPSDAVPQKDSGHFEDVNNDGIPDLVFQFPTQAIGVRCNDTALFLTGKTTNGTGIQGSEAIQTVGCKF